MKIFSHSLDAGSVSGCYEIKNDKHYFTELKFKSSEVIGWVERLPFDIVYDKYSDNTIRQNIVIKEKTDELDLFLVDFAKIICEDIYMEERYFD